MAERGKRQVDEARLRKLEARRRELHDELRELERAEYERADELRPRLVNRPASMLPGGVTYVTGMTTGSVGSTACAGVQLKNQPSSLLPGGVTYVTGRVGFASPNAARLRLLQELSAVRQELVDMRAEASTATGETAVIPARITEAERVAEALRALFKPDGIVPKGMVWDSVDRMLRKHGVRTSRSTYFRAKHLNRARLANTTSNQSQV
jgi:hypothetical protein